ncbi:hypothetical protein FRC08_017675 [Ceratobasidium sp. 394]|nr:hypothetical protein FRC08_017675 [Ceratobasidium sp. 394]
MLAASTASCTNDHGPRRYATRAEKAGVGTRDGMLPGLAIIQSQWASLSLATIVIRPRRHSGEKTRKVARFATRE